MSYHAMFIKTVNGDGHPQFRCKWAVEGKDAIDYNPPTKFSPAEYFVNVKRKPPVGKFSRAPHTYM